MDEVARWPTRDRRALFRATADQMGVADLIVEKDFWVCWVLKRLFAAGADRHAFVFKGGTSLSKAYAAIDRFSEDVDLSFDRTAFGYADRRDPGAAETGSGRRRLLDALSADVAAYVGGPFRTGLEAQIAEHLEDKHGHLRVAPDDAQALLFHYPPALDKQAYALGAYVASAVRIEMGARGEQLPAEAAIIRPYAAIGGDVPMPDVEVRVLAVERTFWEKATILHAEHHRGRPGPPRLSRHYYDLAMLDARGFADRATADLALLAAVADHKTLYFPAAWASYGTARAGTLRLRPAEASWKELADDYRKMQAMFFGPPPDFDEIMARIGALEDRINATAPGAAAG